MSVLKGKPFLKSMKSMFFSYLYIFTKVLFGEKELWQMFAHIINKIYVR